MEYTESRYKFQQITHWRNNHSNVANYMFLMRPDNYSISPLDEHYLVRITLTGCGLSLVGCIICLFLICFLPRQKGDGPFVVANLCTALLTAQLAFIGAENAYPTITWCKCATAVLHYFYLTIHFWSLCYSLHLMMKLLGVLQTEKCTRRLVLMSVGWLVPTFIVGITAVLRGDTYGHDELCWLTTKHKTRLAFLAPVYFIMSVNFFVTIIMFFARLTHDSKKRVPYTKRIRHQIMTFVTLVPVLSLTWIFGVFSSLAAQYLFVLLNSSQGLMILLGHMMFSTPIKALLLTKVKGEIPPPKNQQKKTASTGSSESSDETDVLQYHCPAETTARKTSVKPHHQLPVLRTSFQETPAQQ